MNGYYQLIIEVLQSNHWVFLKAAKGSHEIWQSTISGKKVTVPRSTKSRHTANQIMKQANIKHKF